jgi:serine protease Do
MVYRRLGIAVLLVVPAILTTFVIGSRAGTAVHADFQPTLRIVTPGVSEVITQDLTPEIARSLHMEQQEGVLISDVEPSPLHPGDVILSINGHLVGCEGELNALLSHVASGETFNAEIFRDGMVLKMTLQRAMDAPPAPAVLSGTTDIRGIQVASLSNQTGVAVTEVQIGTAASNAGLKRGDVILEVDGHPIHSAAEFLQLVRQLGNLDATFRVHQADGHINVFVIPSEP